MSLSKGASVLIETSSSLPPWAKAGALCAIRDDTAISIMHRLPLLNRLALSCSLDFSVIFALQARGSKSTGTAPRPLLSGTAVPIKFYLYQPELQCYLCALCRLLQLLGRLRSAVSADSIAGRALRTSFRAALA